MGAVAEQPGLPSLLKTAQTNSLEGFDVARHAFLKILRNYSIYGGKVLAYQYFSEILEACLSGEPP